MAPIPGWVYVILGIVMILASQLIKNSDGSKPLLIFLFVGILFVIIGFGKYIFRGVFKKKKEPTYKKHVHPAMPRIHNPPQHTAHPQQPPQTHPAAHQKATHPQSPHEVHRATQHPQHLSIIACPACGVRHYNYARYCMKCGTRIKKH